MNWPVWLNNPTLWLCMLAGSVGAVWALSEIIGQFRTETPRALFTWGSWMLIVVNFIAATVIFFIGDSADARRKKLARRFVNRAVVADGVSQRQPEIVTATG